MLCGAYRAAIPLSGLVGACPVYLSMTRGHTGRGLDPYLGYVLVDNPGSRPVARGSPRCRAFIRPTRCQRKEDLNSRSGVEKKDLFHWNPLARVPASEKDERPRAEGPESVAPLSIVVVEREPDSESDLVMRHRAIFDMAAHLSTTLNQPTCRKVRDARPTAF